MKSLRGSLLCFGIAFLGTLVLVPGVAQAQVFGTIQGFITSEDGKALPGVTVTVTNTQTGAERIVQTDERGYYKAQALQSGIYNVRAGLEGFQTVVQEEIKLFVNQTFDVDLQMGLAAQTEVITVTSEAPLVEVSRSSAATYVSETEIDALPIIGRDFKEFAFLTPTVQDDPIRGFITMSGQRGIYSGLNIDGTSGKSAFFGYGRGGEATENDGLVVAQDSVKEFQVITNGFSPEYSENGGGYINVITQSGTNDLKGSAFFFFRDDSMAEDLPSSPLDDFRGIDGSRPVDEFERQNWGMTIGGPITRDRTHFFFSYDQTTRDQPFTRDLSIPGLYDAILQRAQSEPEFATLVDGFQRNPDGTATGLFTRMVDNLILFGKVDHQFNDSNSGSIRLNFTDYERISTFQDEESQKLEDTTSLVGSLISLIGDDKINEARIQIAEDNLDRLSDRVNQPIRAELQFRVGGRTDAVGKQFFLPIFVTEEKLQIQDNFSYLFGTHDLKFGIDYQKDDLSQLFAGFADGRYRFGSLEEFLANDADFALIFFGNNNNPNYDEAQEITAFYAQDSWKPNSRLTINYGFRFSQTDNPGPFDHVFADAREIPDDTDNFGPRFGFAYSPGNGRDVIRGGAGLFHARTPSLLFAGPVVQNGLFPNFGILFLLPFFTGFVPLGEPIDNLNPNPNVTPEPNIVDPNFEDPETLRFNLGYERDLGNNWSAGVDLVYAEGDKLQSNIDANLFAPTYDAFGRPIYSDDRPNEDFNEIFSRTSIGESEYTAITLKINRRYAGRYQFQAHYTWSEDKDTDSNERSATSATVSDITNINYDFGLSERDVENRFVLSGLINLPYDFRISGIVEFRDGTPYTATDQFLEDDYCPHSNCPDIRAVINGNLVGRNTFRNDSIERIDLRVSKLFGLGNWDLEIFGEVFNLLDENTFFVDGDEAEASLGDGVTPNPEFGIPDNLVTTPRQFQLGARIRFN